MSPEWWLNPGFGTQKKCPFTQNRDVPLIEVRLYEHFSGSSFVSLEWTCLLNRDVPKEKFHRIVTTLSPPHRVYSYQKYFQSPVV